MKSFPTIRGCPTCAEAGRAWLRVILGVSRKTALGDLLAAFLDSFLLLKGIVRRTRKDDEISTFGTFFRSTVTATPQPPKLSPNSTTPTEGR